MKIRTKNSKVPDAWKFAYVNENIISFTYANFNEFLWKFFQTASNFPHSDDQNVFSQIQQAPGPTSER